MFVCVCEFFRNQKWEKCISQRIYLLFSCKNVLLFFFFCFFSLIIIRPPIGFLVQVGIFFASNREKWPEIGIFKNNRIYVNFKDKARHFQINLRTSYKKMINFCHHLLPLRISSQKMFLNSHNKLIFQVHKPKCIEKPTRTL